MSKTTPIAIQIHRNMNASSTIVSVASPKVNAAMGIRFLSIRERRRML